MGFGKNVRGKVYFLNEFMYGILVRCFVKCGFKEEWFGGRELRLV